MKNRNSFFISIAAISAGLVFLQLFRMGFAWILWRVMPKGMVTAHVPNTIFMGIMSIFFIIRFYGQGYKFMPKVYSSKEKWAMIIFSSLCFLLTASALIFDHALAGIYLLFHGSIVIPLYEETLFRGLIWQYLKKRGANEWLIYAVVTLLFGFWHIGYVDSIVLRVVDNRLFFIMAMKVATGMIVGVVTGAARMKKDYIYYAVLLHSLWNTFAR